MVSVDEADRDVLRFIWVDDASKVSPDLRVYRFTRVVFGVSSSPFLLNATIRFHLEKYLESNGSLVRHLLDSTYVDDIISGGDTEDEVFRLYAESLPRGRIQPTEVSDQLSTSPRAHRSSRGPGVTQLTYPG